MVSRHLRRGRVGALQAFWSGAGNRPGAGRRREFPAAGCEPLEPRLLLSFSTLYTFPSGTDTTPSGPQDLVMDGDGNLYGTTGAGGDYTFGTLFELPKGANSINILHSFGGLGDGAFPAGDLVLDGQGNLYGTTGGTIYKFDLSSGTYTTLHTFTPEEGSYANSIALDGQGHLYGTVDSPGYGGVYEFDLDSGDLTRVYTFTGSAAYSLPGNLAFDSQGNLYGTTHGDYAGSHFGSVFEIPASGQPRIAYEFPVGAFGGYAVAAWPDSLVIDSKDNVYVSTETGTLFTLVPGVGFFQIDGFPATGPGRDSPVNQVPQGLTIDADGNLFGTTQTGGENYTGTVFKVVYGGPDVILHTFTGGGDAYPEGNLVLDSDGNVYGIAGGSWGSQSSIFKIAPDRPPTALDLSSTTVAENQLAGTQVGTFTTTDPDADDTFTYELVDGDGADDNGSFTIDGDKLLTGDVFSQAAQGSYSIRVRSTDSAGLSIEQVFTITIGPAANHAPTDMGLSANSVDENQPAGTTVGSFSGADSDAGDSLTYTLVSGAGGQDNGSFTIDGNLLKTGASFDYEATSSYTIRVRATDQGGLYIEKSFTISVSDVNEPPTLEGFSRHVIPHSYVAFTTAAFTAAFSDPDAGDTLQTVRITALPASGSLRLNAQAVTAGQEIPAGQLGSLTYWPDAGFVGADSFTWNGSDGQLYSLNDATVDLNVTPAASVNGITMLTPINADPDHDPVDTASANGLAMFIASDPEHGLELWKSNGTIAGTGLVKDINPGPSDSGIRFLDVMNDVLYFKADDGVHGEELWRSDGTDAGTYMVAQINQSGWGSWPRALRVAGNTLFFMADDGRHGVELWATDGTQAGTHLVKDITPNGDSWVGSTGVLGGSLYFSFDDGTHGEELWKSDGTAAGTMMVKDICPDGGSNPDDLFAANGVLYFTADDGVHGAEPWRTDGTAAGTKMVKDINPGPAGSGDLFSPSAVLGNTFYFTANDGSHGVEVWKSNGTAGGTSLLKDIRPGSAGSALAGELGYSIINLGGTLLFVADDGVHGESIWKSDGAGPGTSWVAPVDMRGLELQGSAALVRGSLYFGAFDAAHGIELWRSDATAAGTGMVGDINPGPGDSRPEYLTEVDGRLFFFADNGTDGTALWTYAPSAPAAGADLTVAVGSPTPARATYIPGDTITFPVTIRNVGTQAAGATASTPITVAVRASTDSACDDTDTLLANLNLTAGIAPGGSVTKQVTVKLTTAVAPGSLYAVAKVDAAGAINEADETNNTAATSNPFEVAWQFGSVPGRNGATALTFTDASGDAVTLSLSGPGTGTLDLAQPGNGDASGIVLDGTTEKSRLSITTKGPGGTTLGGLDTGGSPLGAIVAPTTDLVGEVSIGPAVSDKASVAITFGRINNVDITSQMAIKSLTAIDWLDDDETPDTLAAPSIGSITITGRKANAKTGVQALRGDFQADLDLGGSAATAPTLGPVTIAGNLSGALWDIPGTMGALTVKGLAGGAAPGDELTVMTAGSMGAITLGAADRADFLAGVDASIAGDPTITRRADDVLDFVNSSASIKSVTIKPAKGAAGPFFVDSNFSAQTIGAVALVDVKFNNDDPGLDQTQDNFGLWTVSIKSVKHTDTTNPKNKLQNWSWKSGGALPLNLDDLNIAPMA